MEVIEKKVISIINSAGEKYSYVYIPYDRSRRVSDIRIKVYNESGKQIKTYSKSDLNDISQSDDSALTLMTEHYISKFQMQITLTL